TLDMDAVLEGADLTASRIQVKGAAIASEVSGSLRKGVFNYRLGLNVSDLSQLTPRLQGTLTLRGNVNGPLGKESLSASGNALLATTGFVRQRINITLQADGLSALQNAKLNMEGRLDDAPLMVQATWRNRHAGLAARWRSLDAKGGVDVGKNNSLSGQVRLTLRRMADIAILTGQEIEGSLEASLGLRPGGGKTQATIDATAKGLRM